MINRKYIMILMVLLIGVGTVSATINITTTMQTVWDLVDNLVDNTDSIVGLFIIGVVIMVMAAIGKFVKSTLDKSVNNK